LQTASQKVEQLNEAKMQLEREKLQKDYEINMYRNKTERDYRENLSKNDDRRTAVEVM